jgi:hypothetical protein
LGDRDIEEGGEAGGGEGVAAEGEEVVCEAHLPDLQETLPRSRQR